MEHSIRLAIRGLRRARRSSVVAVGKEIEVDRELSLFDGVRRRLHHEPMRKHSYYIGPRNEWNPYR